MFLAGKWVEFEKIILGKVTKTQKDKHCIVFSHLKLLVPNFQMSAHDLE